MILDFDLDFLEDAARLSMQVWSASRGRPRPALIQIRSVSTIKIEYIAGFGFVACQTYATAIVRRSKLEKSEALTRGPKHRTGRSIVELINAAANHWKHSCEWSLDAPTARAKRTLEVIRSLGVDSDGSYPVSNTLYRILTPLPARMANLIPFLAQWRDALLK